ncbi:MAG: GNAT family N-acetyltransferase [Phycisphaerales bacterium]|nr:MAG: GNAT family N-acetyltransferase [Phycisphaerales bacterium]
MNRETCRRDYADDPRLLQHVFSLLDLAFPGLAAHARALQPIGLSWDEVSTPFLIFDGDRSISHVGVLEIPMIVDGQEMLIGGIHAVCTHPDHRRRGYFRLVMDEALAWCDERYATAMLIAGTPEIYEPFGFRVLRESRFVAPIRRSAGAQDGTRLRQLDLRLPDDLRCLHRLLDQRAPVSQRLGVIRERAVFPFQQAHKPMWYAEDLDAVLCFEIGDATLRLYDVVATRIPTFQQIVDRIDLPLERVEVYFAPDQLDATLSPQLHVLEENSYLMVRGEFPCGHSEIMLPRTARF